MKDFDADDWKMFYALIAAIILIAWAVIDKYSLADYIRWHGKDGRDTEGGKQDTLRGDKNFTSHGSD